MPILYLLMVGETGGSDPVLFIFYFRHFANDSIAPFEAAYGEMFENPVTPTPELVNMMRPLLALRI